MYAENPEELALLKQIWALMIHEGRVTDRNAEWCYYSGDYSDGLNRAWNNRMLGVDNNKALRADILKHGVNWYRVDVPEYECRSEFVDSFSPSRDVHVWSGEILLNNGTKYFITARDIDLQPLVDRLTNGHVQADLVKLYFG